MKRSIQIKIEKNKKSKWRRAFFDLISFRKCRRNRESKERRFRWWCSTERHLFIERGVIHQMTLSKHHRKLEEHQQRDLRAHWKRSGTKSSIEPSSKSLGHRTFIEMKTVNFIIFMGTTSTDPILTCFNDEPRSLNLEYSWTQNKIEKKLEKIKMPAKRPQGKIHFNIDSSINVQRFI